MDAKGKTMEDKLNYSIKKNDDGKKLYNYMKFELKMSTRLSRKLLRGGSVTVNGKPGKSSDILKDGDNIEIYLSSDETQDIEPQDIPLEVVYEDNDLLIVNKPSGMVVHPTKGHLEGTLANAVMNYFSVTNQNSIVRLVNRIDRDTSGLVVKAKSQFAHQAMARKMDMDEIEKYYIAIVEGRLTGKGEINLPIDRPSYDSIKREVMEEGYRAVTHYEVLHSSEEMSCVFVRLETGKTHQIRVHMSHIGHPIVGDTLYGRESPYIERQALHAYKLVFNHLRNNTPLEITAHLPEDMKKLQSMIIETK